MPGSGMGRFQQSDCQVVQVFNADPVAAKYRYRSSGVTVKFPSKQKTSSFITMVGQCCVISSDPARILIESYAQATDWAAAKDPTSGDTYYYHRKTRDVSWSPPPGKFVMLSKNSIVSRLSNICFTISGWNELPVNQKVINKQTYQSGIGNSLHPM